MWEKVFEADDAIATAKDRDRRHRKLTRDVAATTARRDEAEATRARLAEVVDDELRDVERLEGGWLALVHRVLGNRDERLEVERREHLEAALQHDRARTEVEEHTARLRQLQAELVDLGDPAGALHAARQAKVEVLARIDDPRAAELDDLAETRSTVAADRREAEEAAVAATHAAGWLAHAAEQLRSAGSWGTWDLMGGGMLSSMAKRSRMDEARRSIHQAGLALERLDDELDDVRADLADAPALETGLAGRTMDVFFDNLVTDWLVQDEIRHAERTVARAQAEVDTVRGQLADLVAGLDTRLEQLADRMTELIDAAG